MHQRVLGSALALSIPTELIGCWQCITNSHHMCVSECISTSLYVLHDMLVFQGFSLLCNTLLWESSELQLKLFICPLWLHKHIEGDRTQHKDKPTNVIYIISVTQVCARRAWIKTKQDTLGDLIRLAQPHRFAAALSHSAIFVSVKELAQTCRAVFFFFDSFLACSPWSAVLRVSCCDCGAQLNLKLLI